MPGVSVIALCVALVAAASVGQSQTSDSGESYLSRGSSLLQAGDYPHAREQLVAAIERNPRTVQGRVMLGICEFQLGKYNDAASALQEALRLDPNSEAAHYNLALAWVRLQKIDEGISEFQKVVAQNPKMSAA